MGFHPDSVYRGKAIFYSFFTFPLLPGFLFATVLLVEISYALRAICVALKPPSSILVFAAWAILPLIGITLFMQIAFGAIDTRMHGMGPVPGLGDATTMWLIFCGLSFAVSTITYSPFVGQNRKRENVLYVN